MLFVFSSQYIVEYGKLVCDGSSTSTAVYASFQDGRKDLVSMGTKSFGFRPQSMPGNNIAVKA